MITVKQPLNTLILLLVVGALFLFSACGGGDTASTSTEAENDTEESTSTSEREDPDSDTDTEESIESALPQGTGGEAMEYESLKAYLPNDIDGYSPVDDASGSQLKTPYGEYAQAEQTFSKGDDELMVVIGDYNLAVAQLNVISAAWTMSYEDDENKAGGVTLSDEIKGWEAYNKVDKEANLTLIVGNRFLVNLSAENQESTDFIKSVAQSMNLDALVKLGK